MINTTGLSKNASVDERALRRLRRNEARSAADQALSSPIATDQKSDKRDTVVYVDNVKINGHGSNSNKSYPAGSQPESHHSVLSSEEQSPALVGDLASGFFFILHGQLTQRPSLENRTRKLTSLVLTMQSGKILILNSVSPFRVGSQLKLLRIRLPMFCVINSTNRFISFSSTNLELSKII